MSKICHRYRIVIFALFLFLSIGGCAVERGKVYGAEGKRYCVASGIWRGKWWQHYERAVSCTKGKFWDEAIASFKSALADKRGQKDRWRANTYGVRVIDGYFPHRELGIVYYRLNRYSEAQHELEHSLNTVESAKAKFYLNKTRRVLLQQTKRDTAPPRIRLDGPADGLLTNALNVEVTGHAEDDTYVAALAINGREQFVELAQPRLPFARKVALQDGSNTIDIVAVDLQGRQTRQQVTVHLDRHGPLVSLSQVERLGLSLHTRARVQGFVSDHSPIRRFALAGRQVNLLPGTDGAFDEEIPVGLDQASLPFEAEDAAGNVTRGKIALARPTGHPKPGTREGGLTVPELPRWASLHSDTVIADQPMSFAAPFTVAKRHRDTTGPVIELTRDPMMGGGGNCPSRDLAVVYDDSIYLEVKVTDDSDIASFSIEGKSLWRRRGKQLFFAYVAPLRLQRDNGFLLEAIDERGNVTRCEIVVTHEVQKARQISSRLRVFLEPFKTLCNPGILAATVHDHLLSAIIARKRFNLMNIEKGIEGALEGTVCESDVPETPKSLEVIARFVDTDTDESEFTEDVYGEDLTRTDVKTLMAGLALKLHRHFPLEEGAITARKGKKLWTDLTKTHRVRPRMKLIVFREARVLGDKTSGPTRHEILGEARIVDVSDRSSVATLLTPGSTRDIRERDRVITK
jgi:hypothetical protein